MAAAMLASVSAHSVFSSRGRCSLPKRQVNRQKLWLNSRKTSRLPRATARVSGNGQASVARILARNSAQQKALSAYQPKALLARRCSQAKANSAPSTSETTMFMANSVRWFHQVCSCHWRSASGSPRRTSPRPGVCSARPCTRIQTLLVPACRADSGSSQKRGMFQLRDRGSTRCRSRHSRSPFTKTSPAMTMECRASATVSAGVAGG